MLAEAEFNRASPKSGLAPRYARSVVTHRDGWRQANGAKGAVNNAAPSAQPGGQHGCRLPGLGLGRLGTRVASCCRHPAIQTIYNYGAQYNSPSSRLVD
jgi:hypothetical protein